MSLVEIKNLKKYYPAQKGILHAVDDVTLSIAKGQTLGVVGESGCGKSTLGKTMIRMEDVTEGSISFDGREITGMSQRSIW